MEFRRAANLFVIAFVAMPLYAARVTLFDWPCWRSDHALDRQREADRHASRFFAWTTALTATDGTWRATIRGNAASDAFAVTIEFPWPPLTSLMTAD